MADLASYLTIETILVTHSPLLPSEYLGQPSKGSTVVYRPDNAYRTKDN